MPKLRQNLTLLCTTTVLACGSPTSHPEITVEDIEADIIGRNTGGTVPWVFGDEPKEISILEHDQSGNRVTLVVNIDSRPAAGGKLRLHYEWIADDWALTRLENIDFSPDL